MRVREINSCVPRFDDATLVEAYAKIDLVQILDEVNKQVTLAKQAVQGTDFAQACDNAVRLLVIAKINAGV